jgi:hypothetical protein
LDNDGAPTPRSVTGRRRLGVVLVAVGLAWACLSLLDPERRTGIPAGPLLAAAGLLLAGRPRHARLVAPAMMAAGAAVAAYGLPEFRGDSASYFAYVRSAVFDHDLDFANEWEHWGHPELPLTPTGLRQNLQSVGPALLWTPFYLMAHAYVELGLAAAPYPADGYSAPYRRAAALGTLAAVALAAALLHAALARRFGARIALLAVGAALAASPIAYYAFVVPTMAHGPAFAAAAVLVWAWDRAERRPSARTWAALGGAVGLVALMRWQGIVCALLAAPLLVQQLQRKTARAGWALLAAAAGAAVFVPQLVAWKLLYGRFVTVPQGRGFLDWSSPHLWDTLLSADHGLFTWTPVLLLGLAGLALMLRGSPVFAVGGLLVFAATAWVNGAVRDWAAGDAFGARRYDVVVPLLAAGIAMLLARAGPLLARHPLLAPAMVLAALALWNVGFIAVFRGGAYPQAAPLERVARDQARVLKAAAQGLLGLLAGSRGRALAYKTLQGEYFYTAFNRGGTIVPADPVAPERYLLSGWSTRGRLAGRPDFRWALYPEACVRIPLEEPFDLRVEIEAFAPPAAQPQTMSVLANGTVVGAGPLSPEGSRVQVFVPEGRLVPGENRLCLRFSTALPAEADRAAAAGVWVIQLP